MDISFSEVNQETIEINHHDETCYLSPPTNQKDQAIVQSNQVKEDVTTSIVGKQIKEHYQESNLNTQRSLSLCHTNFQNQFCKQSTPNINDFT